MTNFDDGDIKIFAKQSKQDDEASLIKLIEESNIQRNNGNISKASKLGEDISSLILNLDEIEDADFKSAVKSPVIDEKVMYQIRMLLTFSAESSLHRVVNTAILSTTAVNAMYDKLMQNDIQFYDDTTDAFTFYYIALRKQNNIVERIGKRFSMLCGKENDEELMKIGSQLYLIFCRIISEIIDRVDFAVD